VIEIGVAGVSGILTWTLLEYLIHRWGGHDRRFRRTPFGKEHVRHHIEGDYFAVMGLSEDEAQEKFGFLLDAFKFGAPPHGGIAVGMDRIVALLAGTDSIRDVIAFPKSGGGYDPLTAAPAPITPEQRKEAGVDATPAKDVPPGE